MMHKDGWTSLFIVAALSGCVGGGAQYSGDGRLMDNGPRAATDRYILDLGPISLTDQGSVTYTLKGLPSTDFVVGIELRAPTSRIETGSINPTVAIAVMDGSRTIVTKRASLRDWTWSIHGTGNYAFIYGREEPSTYFTPAPGKSYRLTVTIEQPDRAAANYGTTLAVKSAGWK
jgi:hypothetical protein